jgi:hypothetical protein
MEGAVFLDQAFKPVGLIVTGFGIEGISGMMTGFVKEGQGGEGPTWLGPVEGAVFGPGAPGSNQEGDPVGRGEEAEFAQ